MSDQSWWVARIVDAVRRELAERRNPPLSTYRVEFHPQHMSFRRAAELVPYLSELGISHLYASPCRKTRAGATHGYAIVDFDRLNDELGTPDDYAAMLEALRRHDMGQLLDIVANHMAAAPGENAWWTDVLENGPGSPYAAFFDIDWYPAKEELRNKLLLPLLGDPYGAALEAGQLRLELAEGALVVRYYDNTLPLDPRTYPAVLGRQIEQLRQHMAADAPDMLELESILTALEHLPGRNDQTPEKIVERQREKDLIKKRIKQLVESSPTVAAMIERNLVELNGKPDDAASFDELHKLLDAQVWRLSHWKAAADEINYRRFFDVNELAALCMEDRAVFEKSHRFLFEMLADGDRLGVRIDHIDGLFDPPAYLWRLQQGFLRVMGQRAYQSLLGHQPTLSDADAAGEPPKWEDLEPAVLKPLTDAVGETGLPLYVAVEKILGPEEPLPEQWPVEGTTGYDFLRVVGGLFVDWGGFDEMVRVFARFVGHNDDFRRVARDSKHLILSAAMSSELQLLALRLNRLSERHRRCRDFTLNMLRLALREIIACFPVYRTYLRPGEITENDRRFVLSAVAQAKRRNPAIDAGVFDFVRDVLLLEQPAALDEAGHRQRALFVGRFQQVTSPVMAKGVEDTASYRYFPLSSLCEVGDDPAGRPVSPEIFHRENLARQRDWPASMLCTTTHDTKRSEDVRARLAVLSEMPRQWGHALNRFARHNRRHRRDVEGAPAPSRADEYLFYQTLVGFWPPEWPKKRDHAQLVERMQAYMEKATREAKVSTSWLNPHAEYDAAVRAFIAAALENRPRNRFLVEFRQFHAQIAALGLYTSLSQTLLKILSPGVPDIYQGQELWDFSLVDPDNRRPVDFALRRRLLARLRHEARQGDDARLALARRLAANPADPLLKLYVTSEALRFRWEHSEVFREGCYAPATALGSQADHVCGLLWTVAKSERWPKQTVVAVAPRLIAQLMQVAPREPDHPPAPIGAAVWRDTSLVLPVHVRGPWRDLFTGRTLRSSAATLRLADVLADFPVAILVNGG